MHLFTLITVQFHCILEKHEKTEDNSIIFISVFSIPNAVNYFLSILVNNVMIYECDLVINLQTVTVQQFHKKTFIIVPNVVLFSFILGSQGAKSSIAVHLCYGVCSGGNKS